MPEGAVLDRPPTSNVNGSGPASEGSPHKPSLLERLSADKAKGKEARLRTGEKVSRFFSNMKQKLYGGIDIAFAAPSIAGTLGGEVGSFAKDKAERVKNSVVEAGHRANDSIVDTRDRWVKRTQDAGDVARGRMKEAGYAAGRKTVELGRKAAGLGVISVEPIAQRIDAVFQIPADITQLRADLATNIARNLTEGAVAKLAKGEARAAELRERAEKVQREAQARFSSMGKEQEGANKRAQDLGAKAAERRAKVGVFDKVKNLATALLAS